MAPAKKAVVMIYAAGSLRHVLPSLLSAFQAISGVTAETRADNGQHSTEIG